MLYQLNYCRFEATQGHPVLKRDAPEIWLPAIAVKQSPETG